MDPDVSILSAGQDFLALVGTVFAAFFLLSLSVETILENFRGALALFGITWLKSKKSLQQGLDEVADMVPADMKEVAKFQALVTFVEKTSGDIGSIRKKIETIRGELEKAVDPVGKLVIVDKEKEWILAATAPIRASMEASEDNRVFALRIISTGIGIAVSCAVGINVSDIVMGSTGSDGLLHVFGYVIGGLAAAGGSSFWHDQLDKVRNAKTVAAQLA